LGTRIQSRFGARIPTASIIRDPSRTNRKEKDLTQTDPDVLILAVRGALRVAIDVPAVFAQYERGLKIYTQPVTIQPGVSGQQRYFISHYHAPVIGKLLEKAHTFERGPCPGSSGNERPEGITAQKPFHGRLVTIRPRRHSRLAHRVDPQIEKFINDLIALNAPHLAKTLYKETLETMCGFPGVNPLRERLRALERDGAPALAPGESESVPDKISLD